MFFYITSFMVSVAAGIVANCLFKAASYCVSKWLNGVKHGDKPAS